MTINNIFFLCDVSANFNRIKGAKDKKKRIKLHDYTGKSLQAAINTVGGYSVLHGLYKLDKNGIKRKQKTNYKIPFYKKPEEKLSYKFENELRKRYPEKYGLKKVENYRPFKGNLAKDIDKAIQAEPGALLLTGLLTSAAIGNIGQGITESVINKIRNAKNKRKSK